MIHNSIIKWLLKGDVSIQYQVFRDLLEQDRKDLQARIGTEGWGAKFLSKRRLDGHWGKKFYQPKWTSSHYSLLDLRTLDIAHDIKPIQDSVNLIANFEKGNDGGINPAGSIGESDVCINGMFLNYASYFKIDEILLKSVVDFILSQNMPDGGFNCRLNRSGAVHSSLHTTISVLEGIIEYKRNGYTYRLSELFAVRKSSEEFILKHHLFLSDRSGEIINKNFLRLSYPSRWRYDILRALDYFRYSQAKWDIRMDEAVQVLHQKKNKDSTWNIQAKHPGQVHFEMEVTGKSSRWNTLRVLRILKHFKQENP